MTRKVMAPFLMLMTACIWGVAFVAQSEATKLIGPFTFNSIRFLLGGLVLLPVIFFMRKSVKREDWKAGILCGIILSAASLFQQYGIGFTTVGKAGFLTTLYIIIVPFLGLMFGKKVDKKLIVGLALALAGLYLLCINGETEGSINYGDVMILICAFLFSCHILVVDRFAQKTDGVIVSCIQFFVGFVLSGLGALLFEKIEMNAIVDAYVPLLYAGFLSCGVAYTLQIIAQKSLEPAIASLIGSLESVVAVIAGWVILGQVMSRREGIGSTLVFVAIILAQLPKRENVLAETQESIDLS